MNEYNFICINCMYFTNGHFEMRSGISYCGYCERYKMEVDSEDGCSNGIFIESEEEE